MPSLPRPRRHGTNFPKRLSDWTSTTGGIAPVSLAAGASVIATAIDFRLGGSVGEGTIVRRRGLLQLTFAANSADADAHGAIGSCIVNGEAFDAGVLSVPTPVAEAFDDRWFQHEYFSLSNRFDTSPQFNIGIVKIDTKGMRKFTRDDVMITVIENDAAANAIQFLLQARTLIKLH